MTYNEFLKTLMTYKKAMEDLLELEKIGINFFDNDRYSLALHYDTLMTVALETHYTDKGIDWINWFIYEADYGMKDFSSVPSYEKNEDGEFVMVNDEGEGRWGARDENGEPICYSYESLYDYVQKYKK